MIGFWIGEACGQRHLALAILFQRVLHRPDPSQRVQHAPADPIGGKGREPHPSGGVETLHGLNQPDRPLLQHVHQHDVWGADLHDELKHQRLVRFDEPQAALGVFLDAVLIPQLLLVLGPQQRDFLQFFQIRSQHDRSFAKPMGKSCPEKCGISRSGA